MNKVSLYVLLMLIFLGLSKSFAPSEQGVRYIINNKVLSNYFKGSPLSLILVDSFKTGFLIKTYYQKYKIIHATHTPKIVTVRTSKKFWEENLKNLGMSIFRRSHLTSNEEITPMPPGIIFINDSSYGHWELHNSGRKVWKFHRAYRYFPRMLGWEDFVPDYTFYNKYLIQTKNDTAYYGPKDEFGEKGSVTSKIYQNTLNKTVTQKIKTKEYLKKYIKYPKLNSDNKNE